MAKQILIIGGGVVGTACAYFLARAGEQVTVIDRGEFGKGCSHGNCGFVCPSHILPLAMPGAVGRTFRALFEKDSPFSIKPRFDPSLWSWLYHFTRRCNERDMLESGRAIQALLNSSRLLYDELFRTEPIDAEWETRGLLFVFLSVAGMTHYDETARLLSDGFGLAATRYEGDALLELEPALKPGLAGAWHYQTDAHLRPDVLMASWRRVLEARGVTILENTEFRGFSTERGRAVAVETSRGLIRGDAFVVAAGAWTPLLNKHL